MQSIPFIPLLLLGSMAALAQGPSGPAINVGKQQQAVHLGLGSAVAPENREAAVKLAREILRTDDTHEITRIKAAETLVGAGTLDAEVKSLEEEMRREPENTIIPSNLYFTLRHLAKDSGSPLRNNDLWVPAAEAVVARKAARLPAAAMDLAKWHFKSGRVRDTGRYSLAAMEAEPGLSFSGAGINDLLAPLSEAGVLEQVATMKHQWLMKLALQAPPRLLPPHPLSDLHAIITVLTKSESTVPLARRLLKASLAIPVKGTGENWLDLAAGQIPEARACGALEDVCRAVMVTLTPPDGESFMPNMNLWAHPGDVLWSRKESPGLVLMKAVREAGLLPELITRLKQLSRTPPGRRPHGLVVEALLVAGCVQTPAEAPALAGEFIKSGLYLEPVLMASLPGLSMLEYYRAKIHSMEDDPPEKMLTEKLFSDALPEAAAASDPAVLRSLLNLQRRVELARLTVDARQRRISAQFSHAGPCVRFLLHAGMATEAEELALAVIKAGGGISGKEAEDRLRLVHSLWRSLHHAGRAEAAESVYLAGRATLNALPKPEGGSSSGVRERTLWMEAALRRGSAADVAADLAAFKSIPHPDERLQLTISRAEAWLAARERGGAALAWLAVDSAREPQLRWLTGAVPQLTSQGLLDIKANPTQPPDRFFAFWPDAAGPPAEMLAVQASGDRQTWKDVSRLAVAAGAGHVPPPADPWVRVECRRKEVSSISPEVGRFHIQSWDGKPDSKLLVDYNSKVAVRFPASETVEWTSLAGTPHPGSTAWTTRLALPVECPVSVPTKTFPFSEKAGAISGWVRIESPVPVNASLYAVDPNGAGTGRMRLRELDVIDGAWLFIAPRFSRKPLPPGAEAGAARYLLEIKPVAREFPVPDVRISMSDWMVQTVAGEKK